MVNPSNISGTSELISMKRGMLHSGLGPIIVCSNNNPGFNLTLLTERSNFASKAFYRKNVTLMDYFKIIAACDMGIG